MAVTAAGPGLDAEVDRSFGRCRYFVIADLTMSEVDSVDNQQNLQSAQGAGIQAAQTVCEHGVRYVVSGHCGPKAFAALQAGKIAVVLGASGTVREAITAFHKGRLKVSEAPDVEGHWV